MVWREVQDCGGIAVVWGVCFLLANSYVLISLLISVLSNYLYLILWQTSQTSRKPVLICVNIQIGHLKKNAKVTDVSFPLPTFELKMASYKTEAYYSNTLSIKAFSVAKFKHQGVTFYPNKC